MPEFFFAKRSCKLNQTHGCAMINSAVNWIVVALLLVAGQETLRVNVSLVTVGVQVTDRLGRDVRGLKV